MKRITKKGKAIIAEFKSSMGFAKIDLEVGKLNKRGEEKRLISDVIPNESKKVHAGDKVHLRVAYKRPDGRFLVYIHSKGWTLVNDLEQSFEVKNAKDLELLIYKTFDKLESDKKIELISENVNEDELTKTEKMLLGYLQNKDLNTLEKEINCDKSLKYKIKNHTNKYVESFMKKYV